MLHQGRVLVVLLALFGLAVAGSACGPAVGKATPTSTVGSPAPSVTPSVTPTPAGCPTPAQPPATALPGYRKQMGMTYDGARNVVVLWGGLGGQDPCDLLNDTWTWNGSSWTRKSPNASPPPGNYPSMAYDATHGLVVLLLGTQTWTWDGVTWAERHPATSPPARSDGAMAFDGATGKVVLFSGGVAPNDTWTWDGETWSQLQPPVSPPARLGAGMAYDELHRVIVLFGGSDPTNTSNDLNDTWTFDGTTWTQQSLAAAPAARYELRLAYNGRTQNVVLWGGRNDQTRTAFTDTWTWDGHQWSQQAPANIPPWLATPGFAYDAARSQVVLFGSGGGAAGSQHTSETWTWDGRNWTRRT